MKYIPFILFISLFFISCDSSYNVEDLEVPESIEEKRALLKEKKTQKQLFTEGERKLDKQLTELKAAIDEQDPAIIKKALVSTMQVKSTDFQRFTEVQGTIQSDDVASAVSEVGGRITRLTVKEGDRVRKGQLIAAIDLEGLDKQEAEVNIALNLAREVYDRQKRLWDQNIGSEIQFLQAKNSKERLEKSLETLSFQKTKANVYAPISGSVEMLMTKQGEVAAPGVPIVQILNTSEVKVVAEVPETLLQAVDAGDKIRVEFPALNREETIKISRIGRTINPANRTFSVEADLRNGKGELKPNLMAIIYINDFSAENVLTIPIDMVQQEINGDKFVYVIEDNKAKKAYVKLGESFDGQAIIKEGLTDKSVIIDSGARTLSEGDVVEIQKSK